jgi:anti-sigma regulatory factor (Ser/Thr protein kinase)
MNQEVRRPVTGIRKDLPASYHAPSIARRALDGWLSDVVEERTAEDVRVAATEVVANAVRHGGLQKDDTIILCGSVGDVVKISVKQPSPVVGAEVQPQADLPEGGLGLRIVDKVATRWGVNQGPPGVVWFEVDK